MLFCLVLSGPVLTSQRAGCTQKLKKMQLFDHLEQGPFFHSQQQTVRKGGKQNFPDDAMPFTTSSLKRKCWEISGNHNWHSYFEGLMAYIITLYFLLSPLDLAYLAGSCAVLYSMGPGFLPNTHFTCSLLLAENTNAHQSYHSLSQPCSLQHFFSKNTAWRRLTISET